ncbi:MAG: DUF4124 domain-containing protein [Gammaproteobacteria bacterium]
MKPKCFFPAALIASCLAAALACPPVFAKKMYRWVDENGRTYLSDQVPPDHAQYRRELLSNKGRVLEVTEKAKTKEQQELAARLNNLKKAQEKIIARQKSDDRVLLSTYRSVDDMNAALGRKMQAMQSERKVLQNNLKQNQNQLDSLLNRAAAHERNGEKTPKPLLDEIEKAKSRIQTAQEDIARQAEKQKSVKAGFEADIERYKYLTQFNTEEAKRLSDQSSELLAADALGLYQCLDSTGCAKAWRIARRFVEVHSTTGIDIDNDRLMMTREPEKDDDLSLSISKLDSKDMGIQLFLDIRCRQSSLGGELCRSRKVQDIRTSFRSYIEAGMNAE